MYKLDLHTHSAASPDGSITAEQYARALENGVLDFVAITDHNSVAFARELQLTLGKAIIVGEEIMTAQGEIIGLYLTKEVKPRMSVLETVTAIKDQGGVVYIPHPFETVRKGLSQESLSAIAEMVDIVEVYNGRAFTQNKGPQATTWARLNKHACAASSDAHGLKGLGTAYTLIKEEPTRDTLIELVLTGHCNMSRPPLRTLLYPKMNRFKKVFKG